MSEPTVALIYVRDSQEVYDLAYNWETAESMVLEGYVAVAVGDDGSRSQAEVQSILDNAMTAVEDCYDLAHWRPSDLFGSTLAGVR